jgi:pyruvate dehydrogenase E1 component alpha subunit
MKLKKEQLLKLYKNLVSSRKLDELTVKGLMEGKVVSFFHSGQGQEAVAVGSCTFLNDDDYIYITHRGHGVASIVAKGASKKEFLAEHYGKATGSCKGISAVHFAEPEKGILGYSMTVGSGFPLSVGWGLAAKKNGRNQVVVCFFGDGTSNRGTLHEAMNLVSMWKLPVVWVCENNGYGVHTPISDAFPREDIADIATAYNMPGVVVDGQDVLAVHEAVSTAIDRARVGDGPSLVECKTYRYNSHSIGMEDWVHNWLRDKKELEAWKKRDPIILFREKLINQGTATEAELDKINSEVDTEMEEIEKFAHESPLPDLSDLGKTLYAD